MSISELQIKLSIQQLRNAGTFAEVYLADTISSSGKQRMAAIKVLKEKWVDNLEILQRFQDEANLLKNLSHPNILRVDGLLEIEKRAGILMEFIDGIDLKQVLRTLRGPLPQSVAFEVSAKIADALHTAYAVKPPKHDAPLRVIHRDIKPSNVMISATGDVKILDFGASFFLSNERNASTQMFQFGSQKYMPPERKQGERGSHRADVYSLGITIIEMFSKSKVNVLPTERIEHDRVIKEHIDAIEINLPNEMWTNRAKETIRRMCAYEKKHRITAEQARGMLIPFHQNSDGPSLSRFAKTHIAPLARRAFTENKGSLSGIILDTREKPTNNPKSGKDQKLEITDIPTFPLPNIEQELGLQKSSAPAPQHHSTPTKSAVRQKNKDKQRFSGLHVPAFLGGVMASTLLVFVIFSTINFGLRHMAQASIASGDGSKDATLEVENVDATQENLLDNEFVVTLKQDESFRFAAIKSSEHDVKLQVSSSKREKSLRVPSGEYELSFKTRPVAGIPVKRTIQIMIEADLTINCRIDHSEGAGCFYPENKPIE